MKKLYGFSLVELLIVIAIIAVLISITAPALSKAREQANRTVCQSNIRQIQLSNTGYSTENDGYYVTAASDIAVGRGNKRRWHGVRDSVNESFDPLRGPLVSYLGDGHIRRCPSFKKVFTMSGQVNAGFEAGCGGYGYNSQYIGGRNDLYGLFEGSKISAKASQVKQPQSTVAFTDTAFRQVISNRQTVFIEYSFAEAPYFHIDPGNKPSGQRPNPTIHFRHLNCTNTVWADCHTSSEKMDMSAPYVTHAIMPEKDTQSMSLGWFGPDSNELFDLN